GVESSSDRGGVGGEDVEVEEERDPAERARLAQERHERGARRIRLRHERPGEGRVAAVDGPTVRARGAAYLGERAHRQHDHDRGQSHRDREAQQRPHPRTALPEAASFPGNRSTPLPDHRRDPNGTEDPPNWSSGGSSMTEAAVVPPLHSPPVPDSTPPAPPPVFGRADVRKKGRTRATRRLVRVGIVVVAGIVVLAGAGIGYVEYRNH